MEMDRPPLGASLITTTFLEGPLGVVLRLSDDGKIFVNEIVPQSQAVLLDVQIGDGIWAVGDHQIGNLCLDKAAWNSFVNHIKVSARPLKFVWFRKIDIGQVDFSASQEKCSESDSVVEEVPTTISRIESEILENDSSEIVVPSMNSIGVEEVVLEPKTNEGNFDSEEDVNNPKDEDANLNVEKMSIKEENVSTPPVTPEKCPLVTIPSAKDNDYSILEKLSQHLFIKEKEKEKSFVAGLMGFRSDNERKLRPFSVVKEGRKFVKSGEVLCVISRPGAVASSPSRKIFYLFSDIIIISSCASLVDASFIVEDVIDLQICKIRRDFFMDKFVSDDLLSDFGGMEASFELQWPMGTMQARCVSVQDKEKWVELIFQSICQSVSFTMNHQIGWKHQYLLGTLHSAVLTSDESLLMEILSAYSNGLLEPCIIDSKDDENFTPLHYACMLRHGNFIDSLVKAGADVFAEDSRGWSALHWAAIQLDGGALTCLTTTIFDVDVVDQEGRTPLLLAVLEGRNRLGHRCSSELKDVMEILLGLQANINIPDTHGYTILHHLSSIWSDDLLLWLLDKYGSKIDILAIDPREGRDALHFCAEGQDLSSSTGEGWNLLAAWGITHDLSRGIPGSRRSQASPTRRSTSVASPSSSPRLNSTTLTSFNGSSVAGDSTDLSVSLEWHRSPALNTLRILLLAGCRPNGKDFHGKTVFHYLAETGSLVWGNQLEEAVQLLMYWGGRLDESPLQLELKQRLENKNLPPIETRYASSNTLDLDVVSLNPVEALREPVFLNPHIETTSPRDKPPPPLCSLCGINFTLFRRQHHCRACNALCCDECSKKRYNYKGSPLRCCDSCFNRMYRKYMEKLRDKAMGERELSQSSSSTSLSHSSSHGSLSNTLGSSSNSKAELLRGASSSTSSSSSSSNTDHQMSTTNQTMSTMNEARDRLRERGEKLSQLNDKSANLANAAGDFAKLARQLKEQQQNKWF